MGEPDARVAGGALHHDAAGFQQPALLGVLDDVKRGAILDRAARIQEFGFAEDFAAGLAAQSFQPYQRRIADGAGKAWRRNSACATA
jgi:hypothetical protein